MSFEADSLWRGRLHDCPVVPRRWRSAVALRRLLLQERPQVVAVELPSFLEAAYRNAVARLPEISVILYPDSIEEERAVIVPVEPTDPFTEAVRTGLEIGAQILFL